MKPYGPATTLLLLPFALLAFPLITVVAIVVGLFRRAAAFDRRWFETHRW